MNVHFAVGIGRLYSSVSSHPIKDGKYFDQSVDSFSRTLFLRTWFI